MRTEELITFYGSKRAATEALGVTRQALEAWGPDVPFLRACQAEVITGGKLKVLKKIYLEFPN